MSMTLTATLLGRRVAVHQPNSMQLTAWNRTISMFSEFADESKPEKLTDAEREEFRHLLDRVYRMVMSLLSDDADKTWLDGMMLSGDVTDEDLKQFMTDAFRELQDEPADPSTPKQPAKRARRTAS